MLQNNGPQPVSVDAVEQWSLAPLSIFATDSCPALPFCMPHIMILTPLYRFFRKLFSIPTSAGTVNHGPQPISRGATVVFCVIYLR